MSGAMTAIRKAGGGDTAGVRVWVVTVVVVVVVGEAIVVLVAAVGGGETAVV